MSVGDPAESIQGRRGAAASPAAARLLAGLSSALLGLGLPALMVVANKSAPAVLVAAAVSANGAALLAGRAGALGARYVRLSRAPVALLVAGLTAICALSAAWSVDPALTRRGLVEGLPELAATFALAAAWPLVAGRGEARWLTAGVALAGALIVFEHLAGMPLHALARARGEAWDLKRSAVPPLLLLWPAAALLWPARRLAALAALVVTVVAGITASHSGAPGAALAVGAALFALALALPRLALGFTGAGLALLIAASPWTGSILTRALPPDARAELREEHAEHRLAIWTAFERRGFDRPWLGHGFDASFSVAEAARPDGAPRPDDSARIVGFHPHDILLQFWIEGGALGLAAAAVAGAFVLVRIAARRGAALAARLGLLASALGVGLVGLSAWQPWWLATIAAALLWFDYVERRDAAAQSARDSASAA